MVGELNIFKGK